MSRLLIWGAGGHGKVVCDILRQAGRAVSAFVDSNPEKRGHFGTPVILEDQIPGGEEFECVIAVGVNEVRRSLSQHIRDNFPQVRFINAVHPSAVIAAEVQMGLGNVVAAGVVIGPSTEIGNHCVLNTRSSVDHDCLVSDFVSIAPGATVGGGVNIGLSSYIGLGAHVIHGVNIGDQTVIGAGATVVRSIGSCLVAFGSPCKVVRSRGSSDQYL